MSFDWGSFLGGVCGAIGAFGAAYWTMQRTKKQQMPSERTSIMVVCKKAEEIYKEAIPLVGKTDLNFNDFYPLALDNVLNHLEDLMLEAAAL